MAVRVARDQGLERRFPHQLSGGQLQRLALARALAPSPQVVLLDEPFSSLDVEVRLRLRSELSGILRACGASVIVTHDPGEALAICDRVAVMRDGALHQCASPQEIVRDPATAFVGSFVLQSNVILCRLPVRRALMRNWQFPESRETGGSSVTGPMNPAFSWIHKPSVLCPILRLKPVFWVGNLRVILEYRIRVGDLMVRARCPLEQTYQTHDRCRVALKDDARWKPFPHRIDRLH